jgi:hypothetical protein
VVIPSHEDTKTKERALLVMSKTVDPLPCLVPSLMLLLTSSEHAPWGMSRRVLIHMTHLLCPCPLVTQALDKFISLILHNLIGDESD